MDCVAMTPACQAPPRTGRTPGVGEGSPVSRVGVGQVGDPARSLLLVAPGGA